MKTLLPFVVMAALAAPAAGQVPDDDPGFTMFRAQTENRLATLEREVASLKKMFQKPTPQATAAPPKPAGDTVLGPTPTVVTFRQVWNPATGRIEFVQVVEPQPAAVAPAVYYPQTAPAVAVTHPTAWPAGSPTPAGTSVTVGTTARTPAVRVQSPSAVTTVTVHTPTPAGFAAGHGPIRGAVRQFFGGT